jgi:adenylosuccinate synthase
LIPAGGLVDLDVLEQEISFLRLTPDRVGIDARAIVIEDFDKQNEKELKLSERLSSTLCGVGSAQSRRVLRNPTVRCVGDIVPRVRWIAPFVTDTATELHKGIKAGKRILVEGTQGFGLSLYHSQHYPCTTSRDTTAAGFLSEVGIGPLCVNHVVVVFRTFPIRVAGKQAGPLVDEISWRDVQAECGCPYPIQEMTSVTHRIRRVGRFDWELAKMAVRYNQPTELAINGIDYLEFDNRSVQSRERLTSKARLFIERLETDTGVLVKYCGTGPGLQDVVERVNSVIPMLSQAGGY